MFYFDKVLGKTVLKSDKMPVEHFFTTRELVLKTKEEDNLIFSLKNRELLIKEFNLISLVTPEQRHTSNISFVESDKTEYKETDALILDKKGMGIFLNFADCTPVVLHDKRNNVAAISHAGWRGTVQKIAVKTVEKMNSNPKDIIALIGPCICFDCFETSDEIADMLLKTVDEKDGLLKKINGKFHADLKEINKRQLEEKGIKEIDTAPFCTCCNNDKFFSYRKENKTTNRVSAFISL